jgi:hypothetical protein
MVGLENGVFIGSPDRHSVEPALARLSGQVEAKTKEQRRSGMTGKRLAKGSDPFARALTDKEKATDFYQQWLFGVAKIAQISCVVPRWLLRE